MPREGAILFESMEHTDPLVLRVGRFTALLAANPRWVSVSYTPRVLTFTIF